jgi:predicted ribosome-associated RNA-binding protein Tma20
LNEKDQLDALKTIADHPAVMRKKEFKKLLLNYKSYRPNLVENKKLFTAWFEAKESDLIKVSDDVIILIVSDNSIHC